MPRLFLCLILLSLQARSENLSIEQWIEYFSSQGITIIYSSDYLTNYNSEILIELNSAGMTEFNQELKRHSLNLVSADPSTYVIQAFKPDSRPTTGLIIKLRDSETKSSIHQFELIFSGQLFTSKDSIIYIDNFIGDSNDITIKAEGYLSLNTALKPVNDQIITETLFLHPAPYHLDDIVVTASKVKFQKNSSSQNFLSREEFNQTVSVTKDPAAVIKSLAGNTNQGLSGKTNTRGGMQNEAIISLDGHIIRNPYHFKSLSSVFSSIHLSPVESIDFYSGVFPMQYGGRLSSVMDIQTSDNLGRSKNELDFNFIDSSYTYRKSSANFDKQFQATFRTGGHLIHTDTLSPEFDDLYLKLTQSLSDSWSQSQHLLVSRDDVSIDSMNDQGQGDQVNTNSQDQDLWLQWFYQGQSELNFQLYSSRKHNRRFATTNNDNSSGVLSEDILTEYSGIRWQQKFSFDHDFSLNYGFDLYSERTDLSHSMQRESTGELAAQLQLNDSIHKDFRFENSGQALEVFLNTRYRWKDRLIFDLGIRYEHKDWIDQTVNSPRFNMSYFINDHSVLRFALGRHQQSQYIDEFLLEDQNPEYFNPTSADIAVLEYSNQLTSTLNFKSEAYIKKYSSTHPYYENLFNAYHFIPELQYDRVRITPDDALAQGLELTLNGKFKLWKWTLNYSFSDVDDEINGDSTPRTWDQHNSVKLLLNHPLRLGSGDNWDLNVNLNYNSGWSKTNLQVENGELHMSARNQDSFDDYYLVDLNLYKQSVTSFGTVAYSLQLNNVLNIQNTCCIDYSLEDQTLQSEDKRWLGFTPNFSIIFQWD